MEDIGQVEDIDRAAGIDRVVGIDRVAGIGQAAGIDQEPVGIVVEPFYFILLLYTSWNV